MLRGFSPILLLVSITLLLGCSGKSTIDCSTNADCLQGNIGGFCHASPTSSESWCAFPDLGCPGTSERWGVASGDGLAGECVEPGTDAGPPDAGAADAAGPTDFAFHFGGVTDETIRKALQAPDGTILAIVPFMGTVTLGGQTITSRGMTDFLVVHLTTDGSVLWMKQFGGPGVDTPSDLTVTPDGSVAILGTFSGTTDFGGGPLTANGPDDFFVLRLDPSGTFLWTKTHGGFDSESATHIDSNAAGDLFVTGYFRGSTTVGDGTILASAGSDDIFLVRYSGVDGTVQWSERIGDTGSEEALTLSVRGPNVAIAGQVAQTVNLGHGPVMVNGGGRFVASYSAATGIHNWSRILAQESPIAPVAVRGLGLLTDGSVAACGVVYGDTDFGAGTFSGGDGTTWLARFDAGGGLSWFRAFDRGNESGNHGMDCTTLAISADDTIAMAGTLVSSVDFGNTVLTATEPGTDAFLACYSKDNEPLVALSFPGMKEEDVVSSSARPQLLVTGSFSGTIGVAGTGDLTSTGGVDSVVIGRVFP